MDQGRSRPRTEPAMNDIIWQNCSKYSSHAEILIAHMGNCIPRASQTHWNNTFAVPVIVTLSTHSQWLQHADNTCCVWNTRWGGIIKKIEWKIEQYCALPGMMFCREYLIFSPSARLPALPRQSQQDLSLTRHTMCLNSKLGTKKSLFNPTIIHLVERTLFPTIFQFPWDF